MSDMTSNKRRVPSQSYDQIRSLYPDAVLLLRVGEFYEAYGEDADILESVCGCVKARRNVGDPWMACVPHYSVEAFAAELGAAGHQVILVTPLEEGR